MKTRFTLLGLALLGPLARAAPAHKANASPAPTLEFIENKGQWAAPVRYAAAVPGGRLFAEADGLRFALFSDVDLPGHRAHPTGEAPVRAHALDLHFDGAAPARLTAETRTAERRNYFLGADAAHWARDVRGYRQLRYAGLWPGVDARVYENAQQRLEYDFEVAPGADAAAIGVRVAGADALHLAPDGRLQVQTSAGTLEELAPQAWQTDARGQRQPVACRYALAGAVVRFVLGEYDHQRALTIDPTVVFATYTGALGDNWGFTATYDAQGNLYSGGIAFNPGYPVSPGAFQTTFGGAIDIALIKYNVAANGPAARVWATYLGGSQAEFPHSLVVNSRGELLLLGTTGSANFPTTAGALQRTFGGGTPADPFGDGVDSYYASHTGSDLIISRFSADGANLLGSTYLGGTGNDGLLPLDAGSTAPQLAHNYGDPFRGDIEVDAADNVYVASCTSSRDFPAARGFQSAYRGGTSDGVVCKLNPGLTALLWGSYLGGSLADGAYSLQIAPGSGEVYVAGGTLSPDLPATAGALNPAALGGTDGFVARLSADGTALRRTTYLGTSAYDQAQFVQLGADGGVYVLGQTLGAYPTTPGLYQNANGRQFIHKLSADLAQTQLATVFGAGRAPVDLVPTAFLVDRCDRVFVCGWGGTANAGRGYPPPYLAANAGTSTAGLPVTPDAVQPTTNGSSFYLAQFAAGLGALGYGTFYGNGSEHVDGGTSRFDPRGVAYQAVCECFNYSGFPIPPGANTYSPVNGTGYTGGYFCNNAAFVLNFRPDVAQAGPDQDVCVAAGPVPLVGSPAGGTWSGPGVSGSAATGFVFTPTPALLGPQMLTYTVAGTGACTTTAARHENVTPAPALVLTPLPVVCSTGNVAQLLVATPPGGTWSGPGVSGSGAAGFYFDARVAGAGTFQLAYQLPDGQCGTRATLPVTVAAPVPAQVPPDSLLCPDNLRPVVLRGTPLGGTWAGYGVSGSPATGFVFNLPPGFDPTSSFVFELIYSVRTAGGCDSRAVWRIGLAPQPVPKATRAPVACPDARQVPLDVQFTLSATSSYPPSYNAPTPPYTLQWDFGDGTQSTDANPTHTYTAAGSYQPVVRLRYNNAQCETAVALAPVEATNDPLPNVITPNGDALNQTFRLPAGCVPRLQMFSRWGQQVFEAAAYRNDWAAAGQPAGLYYYLLEYPDGHRTKGWLEVVK